MSTHHISVHNGKISIEDKALTALTKHARPVDVEHHVLTAVAAAQGSTENQGRSTAYGGAWYIGAVIVKRRCASWHMWVRGVGVVGVGRWEPRE